MDTSLVSVAVCVATHKRPKGLATLLESLIRLNTDSLSVQLILVDNDSSGSARETLESYLELLPFPATYHIEPMRGHSAVRNRLFAEARARGVEFIASCDDDQVVDPMWIVEMVKTAVRYNAGAIAPVRRYAYPAGTSRAIRGCFDDPKSPPSTGSIVRMTTDGGGLFRDSALLDLDPPFDMRANFTGGADELLSLNLSRLGEKIIACDSAIVTEVMTESRLNFRWIASRAWWEGSARARSVKWIEPSLKKTIGYLALSLGYIAKNVLMIPPDLIRYRTLPLRRLRLSVFGISCAKHLVFGGPILEPYRTTDGE